MLLNIQGIMPTKANLLDALLIVKKKTLEVLIWEIWEICKKVMFV